MKIAVAQIRSCMGDLAGARERIVALSSDAARAGAELIVFPSTTILPPEPLCGGDCEGFLSDEAALVRNLASEVACPAILPVHLTMADEPLAEVMLLKDGKVVPLRLMSSMRSMASGRSGEAADAQGLHPALNQPLIGIGGVKFGVALTYEELEDYVSYEYPVDAVLFCTSSGFGLDDASSSLGASLSEGHFMDDAEDMGAWLIGAGGVGLCGSEIYCGSSFAVTPWGEVAAMAPAFEEALMTVDIDPSSEGPLKNPLAEPVFDPAIMAWSALCEGLAGIVASLGATDASIVVDGSLASMLACAVAVDALGPTRVHPTVLLLGKKRSDDASRKLARNLRLEAAELDSAALGADGDVEFARDIAWARVASESRARGWVLLGSADKTSLALGSAPSRDLSCVLPFGDVYRSDILSLSRLRNTISPVIPASARGSFKVEEVALGIRGTDEARVEALDYLLSGFIEWGRPLSELAAECGDAELARNVVAVCRKSLSELPGRLLAPTMSSKTVAEARGPLGLRWRDRVRGDDEKLDLESVVRTFAQGLVPEAGSEGVREAGDEEERGDQESAERVAREALDLLSMLGGLDGEEEGHSASGPLPADKSDAGGSRGDNGGDDGPFWAGGLFSDN